MLLESREAHTSGMTICDFQIRSHAVPIDLRTMLVLGKKGVVGLSNGFVIELLENGVEESRSSTICGHDITSSQACHV